MATAPPLSPPASEQRNEKASDAGGLVTDLMAIEQSLAPSPHQPRAGIESGIPARVARLPVELDVSVPIRNFRIRNLLALEPSHLIESVWGHGGDVPLAAGRVQLAWSEFEVIDAKLAVRLTRLV